MVKKHLVRIFQGHCNLWLELVKNTILKTDLALQCGCRFVKPHQNSSLQFLSLYSLLHAL
jgi:hypothetical protein